MNRFVIVFSSLLCICLLQAGCGQKGALYLPQSSLGAVHGLF